MTSKLTRLTDDELTETLRLATSGYPLPAWVEGNLRQAFAELQERLKADSEPVAYIDKQWTLVYYIPPMSMGLKIGDKLYHHAQPAPVVPDRSIFEQWWESQNGAPLDGWDSLRTTDGYCDDGINGQLEAWSAAMLAAAPHDTPALNSVQSVVTMPGKWIPVSERMPEAGDDMIVFTDGIVMSGISYTKKKGFYIQALEYDDDEPVDSVTHWMPLPAAPQEVSNEK